ncbi:MAG TPA: hypothetical protein VLJ10_01580, partial [Candidatus Bathyarchaeia archaeon]|nr:hypothetical protein [Candidatus Bathyarchaeia archaeon]
VSPLIYGTNFAPKMESTRDILAFMKEIGITCFRYPGGDAPGWHWKGGYADFNEKVVNMPMGRVQAVSGVSQITGAQVIMQVNIESGTPQEAAGLVKYMNQESGTPVTYWELGNEAFGEWDASHTTPENYAQIIKEYAAAMKAIDPSIKIGADWASTYADNVKWDETILRLAGDEIDFLSIHWYPNHTGEGKTYRGRTAPLPEEVMSNALAVPQIVKRARHFIEQYAPKRVGKIELTFLEWDGAWDAPTNDTENKQGVLQWSLANALFYADTFGQFAENGVTVATHYRFQECPFGLIRGWDQAEGWGGQRWDGETIRPKAFALQMFSKFFGNLLIEKKVEGGLSYIKEKDWWQDSYAGPVPYVSVYTSKNSSDGTVRIALINKHPDAEVPVDIVIDDGTGADRKCIARILTGPDLLASNDGAPGTVKIQQSEPFIVNSSFPFPVPARSVVMLEVGEARD